MTRRRIIRIVIVALLFAPIVALSRGASGLSVQDFSGWDMGAKATAIQVVFDSPSLGVPAKPSGELNLAFSEATLQSGPAAYGLGSSAWPGQVVSALPAFIQSTIEAQGGFELPLQIPNYPIRAESFFPQGPTSASLDAGTIHMRSIAKETASEGVSYLNRLQIPFLMSVGNQSSFAQNGFDTQGAVSMVEAVATDISLLEGLVRIDSVVSRATARSDGEKGSVAGGTTISGVHVTGVGDVVVDTQGVKVAGQGIGAGALQQVLNGILNTAGISMELSKPVDTITGPKGSRSLGGLLISIKSSTLEPLIAALPADLQQQIRGQLTLDQYVSLQIAPAVVSAGAVKNFELPPVADVPDVGGVVDDAVEDLPVVPTDTGPTDTGDGTIAAPTTGGTEVVTIRTSFEGVPLWMVVLLMIAAFVSSKPLTAIADRLLAARSGAVACPLEDT